MDYYWGDMADLYLDVIDALDTMIGSSATAGFLTGYITGYAIGLVAIFAVWYYFQGYIWQCIGRKFGLRDDWMPYVPVAADLYRLRMVKAPLWHLFFFGFTGILGLVIVELLLFWIDVEALGIFMLLILIAWAVIYCIVTFLFYRMYYQSFGFNGMMALLHFTPGFNTFARGFDMYIAFKKDIRCLGNGVNDIKTSPKGQIVALAGMYKGAVFSIADNEEITLGRENPECQIIFDQYNTDVSRKHCSIRYSAVSNTYTVVDFSKNGTFTEDGKKLQPNIPVTLSRGSVLCIGSKKNTFRLG